MDGNGYRGKDTRPQTGSSFEINRQLTVIGRDECAEDSHILASGLHAGRTDAENVKFNNLSKSTVKHVKSHYDAFITGGDLTEDFKMNRKEHKRRSNTLDAAIIADIQQLVDQDPGRSMRSMARELGLTKCQVIDSGVSPCFAPWRVYCERFHSIHQMYGWG